MGLVKPSCLFPPEGQTHLPRQATASTSKLLCSHRHGLAGVESGPSPLGKGGSPAYVLLPVPLWCEPHQACWSDWEHHHSASNGVAQPPHSQNLGARLCSPGSHKSGLHEVKQQGGSAGVGRSMVSRRWRLAPTWPGEGRSSSAPVAAPRWAPFSSTGQGVLQALSQKAGFDGANSPDEHVSSTLQCYRCGLLSVESCCDSHYGFKLLISHLTILLRFTEHLELFSSKYITGYYRNILIYFFEASI